MTNLANAKNAGWEVAGGRKLRSSDVDTTKKTNGVTKQTKEAQLLKMPKIDTLPPLKADATIYDFIRDSDEDEEMKKSEPKTRVTRSSLTASSTTGENTKINGASKQPASPKSNKSKQPQESLNLLASSMNSALNAKQKKQATTPQPKNLEHEIRNSIENLNYEDLETEFKSISMLFKDNSNLIAQNFASYFNQLLNNVPEDDFYLKQQNETINPSYFLEKRVSKLLNNIFTKLSKSDSEKVFEYCFESIFSDKNLSTHGFKVVIQLIVKHFPNLLVNNLEKLNEIMKNNKHRHQKCLIALWALGQTGFYNLSNGINVWFEIMLPMINVKNCTNYVVGYLPKLFDLQKSSENTTKSESNLMLSLDQYNTFYELVNDKSQLNLSKELGQKFRSAFLSLRALFIQDCTNNAANIEQFLRILPLNDQNNYKQNDLLEIMSEMVFKNRDTLTIWKQIYNKYLQQSIILLEYLSDNYNRRLRNLKNMRELLYYFNEQSENLLKKQTKSTTQKETKYKKPAKQVVNEVEINRKLNALSTKLIQSHFRRTSKIAMGLRTLFYLTLFVAAFFYWDINANKSIYTNALQKELAKYGLLDHTLKLISTVKQLAFNIQNKVNYYAPIYYKKFNQNVLPVLKAYWNMSVEYFNLVLVKVQPYLNTALVYVQQGVDFINQNYPMLVKNMISVMELAVNYAITMYNLLSVYLAHGIDFVGINLFGYKNGELNRIVLDAFKLCLDYVIKFFQSLEKYFA